VEAIFDYEAGDEDELSFKTGDVINVIDFENPDDVVNISSEFVYLYTIL
jgi:uncharacterized protein YqfB (UPF0267 family)